MSEIRVLVMQRIIGDFLKTLCGKEREALTRITLISSELSSKYSIMIAT